MSRVSHLRQLLDQRQAHLAERVRELEDQLAALTRSRQGEVTDDEHDPEGDTLSAQWSMLTGLLDTAREEGRRVAAARGRADDGTFGACTACGEAIPAAQLEARPWRERCVTCAP